MLPPYTQRGSITLRHYLSGIPLILLSLFIFVSFLSTPLFKQFLTIGNVEDALEGLNAETLVEMLGWQNAYFDTVLPKDYEQISFTKTAFRTVTHISFTDERSLLGNELPGFSIFDTDIIVAGEGTNYTNVPIDSPPPMEYIIKSEKENQASTKNEPKTPPVDVAGAKVFIYSTHSWESYLPLLGKAGAANANLATSYGKNNIHLVDEMLQSQLSKNGVKAVIDETNITDANKAYQDSRKIIQAAIASKTPYQLFIDIHRDSARKDSTTKTINGKSYARVSFIIGKGNPHSDQNKLIAKKLDEKLNNNFPGISKGVFGKSKAQGNGIYNQDLTPHAILIEVGGVDNTMEELQNTVNALAQVISEYVRNAEGI
jgi:stage II sporulation protein P